jgi:hypothetical protein
VSINVLFETEGKPNMKTSRNITLFVSILAIGISAALILRAQEMEMPIQGGTISLTDTNVDWNSMSDLEVELKAVESVPPMPADSVPQAGTFWSAQHAPGSPDAWPPLPGNIHNAPAWDLGDGVFLLSDLDFDYNPPVKFSLNGRSGMMMDAMESGPGGDGSDSGDGGVPPVNTPNYGTNLWLSIAGVSNSFANLFLENTAPAVQYEIQSKQDLTVTGWVSEGFVLGSELTNWTPMNVAQNGRTNLFFRIRSWADDGSGLPIWWQLQYFGTTGVDPNADPEGDGWSNIQKFQNGMNPNVFYTPPTPQGLTVTYNSGSGMANVSWQSSPSPVTGYTVERDDDSSASDFSFSASTNDFNDNISSETPDPDNLGDIDVSYKIQAHYAGGDSAWSASVSVEQKTINGSIISGPQGTAYLAVSALPPNTAAIRLTEYDYWPLTPVFITNYDIPISNFTNGLCPLPNNMVPGDGNYREFFGYIWFGQAVATNGLGLTATAILSGDYTSPQDGFLNSWLVPPFFDGRAQLKQNLIFQLRAATVNDVFHFSNVYPTYDYYLSVTYPTNYVYSGYFDFIEYDTDAGIAYEPTMDTLLPFENNYLFKNFVFNSSDLDSGGHTTTGVSGDYSHDYYNPYGNGFYDYIGDNLILEQPPLYQLSAPTVNGATISSVLATNVTRWLSTYPMDSAYYYLSAIGVTNDTSYSPQIFAMFSGVKNYYGLPFLSAAVGYGSGSAITLSAGNSTTQAGYFYPETAQPQFNIVEYDYWPAPNAFENVFTNGTDYPGMAGLSLTHTNPVLITSVGNAYFPIACYAKLAVVNGYSGVYGYLQQYFDKAYQIDTNGIVTTNTTGVLSSFGNFFATQPGAAALVTMPDVDTGQRGTNVVYAIKLQLDVNHDGAMNLSFNSPDNTSASSPYTHWCNNNYDRFALDEDDGTNYQDDVQVQDCPYTPNIATPDCNYRDIYGIRVIPDTRDLEDFARLWVSGVNSNLLAALPAGSTVTLNWGDVGSPNSGNPTIDLFQATDADGGIEYLTNETSAATQIDPAHSAYVGRLAPGGSVQLNSSFFSGWAGNHFIWCGVTNGSGQLNLTIADANGNVLAQASQWIQIVDIKQMYERWTVGDNLNKAPTNTAYLATEGLPPLASAFQYAPPQDTNTPYILFVHGWNMETWEKDRFAETAFKRFYWQGYQGKFGEFRWPTGSGFTGNFGQLVTDPQEKDNFDNSEYNAWLSGTGLLNKLNDLNTEYPGHVYVLAHSMGNIVTGTALRLAGTTQVVHTYVASQAAVTAHAYDETVPNYSFNVTVGGVNFNLGPNTPNIYGNWFTNNNGGGAGQVINFYNTNDFALSQLHWQLDQLFKPDTLVAESGSLWNYGYSGSTNDPAPWNHFFKTNTVSTTVNFDIVGSLANRYEVMSYAAQSYTTALGATPGVHHVAANVDLTTLWPSPDPLDNNYASHFYHSAEFRGDSVWEWNYWNTLLFSSSSGFNISSP